MNTKQPSKYGNLQELSKLGIKTPKSLLLRQTELGSENYQDQLTQFTSELSDSTFIVRSAVGSEDQSKKSYAGHFLSSDAVSKSQLQATITKLYQANLKLAQKYKVSSSVNLLIQEFIQSSLGGVIFSPWRYFSKHYLVEIGASPKEVVEGRSKEQLIVSKDQQLANLHDFSANYPSALPEKISEVLSKLPPKLALNADLEWILDPEGRLVIVQIRPITAKINSLRLATDEETQKQTERFQEHNQYSWQISPLAETLGSLSPLSFELIIKLYQNAQTTFQNLGFRAREVNFIKRGANGAVYTASDLERQFFQLQSFFTPFTQHFRERDWRTKTVSFVDNFTPRNEQKNSLGRSEIIADLSKIFNYWQIANLYFALKEKNTTTQELNRPDEYELFSYRHVDYPQIKHNTWTELKISLKRLFLWQLSKLKKIVAKDPLWVFAQLEDFIADNFNELELLANYRLQLTQSAVCYPGRLPAGLNLANSKLIAVAGNQEIVGEAVVIVNPDLHSPQLPANKIIVAPFFASKWIGDLSSLKGVVLEQGGQLSHSAIVARELNIPYFINYDGATKLIQTGDHLKLKPKNNLLEQL